MNNLKIKIQLEKVRKEMCPKCKNYLCGLKSKGEYFSIIEWTIRNKNNRFGFYSWLDIAKIGTCKEIKEKEDE